MSQYLLITGTKDEEPCYVMHSNDLSFKEHSLKITLTRTKMIKMCQILNQDKQLLFFFFFFSVKPVLVQLFTNGTTNTAYHGSILNFTCSVGSANPQVTSYHLLENGFCVAPSSSGIWIRVMSSSGMFNYKCLANNTAGTTISAGVNVTVGGIFSVSYK